MKTYDDFFENLGQHESSGDYHKINKIRYMGKYQMGEGSLIDLGYYRRDGNTDDNVYKNKYWTGKEEIKSKEDFLNNPKVQEKAVRDYAKLNWEKMRNENLDLYVGQTVQGVEITVSGLLAAAHNQGAGGVINFLKFGINGKDGFGTTIKKYMKELAGYDTPFKPRKKLTGLKKDKKGKTVMYQIDGKEWVSLESAIQMIKDNILDGVIVTNSHGTVFLRTRPDQTTNNNLV